MNTAHEASWLPRWQSEFILGCGYWKKILMRIPNRTQCEKAWLESQAFRILVEVSGIEPLTSCMPCKRSTNWAIPPKEMCIISAFFLICKHSKSEIVRNFHSFQINIWCKIIFSQSPHWEISKHLRSNSAVWDGANKSRIKQVCERCSQSKSCMLAWYDGYQRLHKRPVNLKQYLQAA